MESLPYYPIHIWRSQALNLGSQIPKPGPLDTHPCSVCGEGGWDGSYPERVKVYQCSLRQAEAGGI